MLFDLTDKDHYDIVTALRGPDFYDNTDPVHANIKYMTTSVIRHFAGLRSHEMDYTVRGFVYSPDAPRVLASLTEDAKRVFNTRAYNHFRNHFAMALQALRRVSPSDELTNYIVWVRANLSPDLV